ncbi:MAG: TMEM175 family protein [Candidatus Omnitrophota bacterium]|nr:TMEM175 family protein [Candidatus Omnitrophota bacterium]
MSDDKRQPLIDEKETGRIEAFSDGVFAIAITLLVWNIKIPHIYERSSDVDLIVALFKQWPSYLAYFISFVTILIMWVSHHRLFNYIKRSNDMFLFLNGLLLMFVTFIPFPTALLAEYVETQHSNFVAAVYAGTYLVIAVVYNILWLYASTGKRLLSKTADPCLVRNITRQYIFGPPLYLVALILAFINAFASVAACFILALFFAFTGAISRLLPCDLCQIHETK